MCIRDRFNTCAVREHAEQRVFGNVGALVHTKRRHPEQKIFLCGCMMGQPQAAERIRNSYVHVDGVFSTHHLWEFPSLLWQTLSGGGRVFATEDEAGSNACLLYTSGFSVYLFSSSARAFPP